MAMMWNPEDYRDNSSAQREWGQTLIEALKLRPGERVLDIGCGDGSLTLELVKRVGATGHVVGIDKSEEMIRFAGERSSGMSNVRFEVRDAVNLTFSEEFDAVFSNATLHWIEDHLSVLRGISRSLVPGGRIVLQMGGGRNAAPILESIGRVAHDPRWKTELQDMQMPYSFYAPANYTPWLAAVHLVPTKLELLKRDMVHKDRAGLIGWIRTTWHPYINRVSAEHQSAFIERVVDDYLSRCPPDEDGRTHVPMERLEVHAVK
jgi:trans-aconitate 2-methyltransferase